MHSGTTSNIESRLSLPRPAVPLLAVLVLLGAAAAFAQQNGRQTVRLIVDYGDGVEKHFTALRWTEGTTVLDAMRRAQASPHGIRFEHTGDGASAFLTKIDDLENEGGGAEAKNWVFRVNGKLATKSFGIFQLKPNDVVKWRFEVFKL